MKRANSREKSKALKSLNIIRTKISEEEMLKAVRLSKESRGKQLRVNTMRMLKWMRMRSLVKTLRKKLAASSKHQ